MKKRHFFVIFLLFLLYAISNYFWLSQNKLPVSYDEGVHLWTSMRFLNAFISPSHNILYDVFHANVTHWPPLVYFVSSLFNLIFGVSYTVSVMTNMLFYLLLIVSLYLIGRKMKSPSVGILSALIVSFYPIIYGHSRLFMLDFPLTAIVTFSIYCLICTKYFKDLKWSIIFGLSAGIGMLIKWSYPLYIISPCVYFILVGLARSNKKQPLFIIRNCFISLLSCFIISFPHYFIGKEGLRKTSTVLGYVVNSTIIFERNVFNYIDNLVAFLRQFNNIALSFIFLSILIVSLLLFYLKIKSKDKMFITLWYLMPIFLLLVVSWKQTRFFMPVLPCLALISAMGLDFILKNKRIRVFILCFIFSVALAHYFNLSLASPLHEIDAGHTGITSVFRGHLERFKSEQLLVGIILDSENKKRLTEDPLRQLFGDRVMSYYLMRELISTDIGFGPEVCLDLKYPEKQWDWVKENKIFLDKMSEMSAIIYISKVKEWPAENEFENIFKDNKEYRRLFELTTRRNAFDLIDRIDLSDGYYANIYFYKTPELKKNKLLVKAFNGKLRIFYEGKELTKYRGITASFSHNGKTYSAKDAVWELYKTSPYQIEMTARYLDIGIKQSISLSVDPDKENTVNIKAQLECSENLTLDNWSLDSFLSDDYKGWIRHFSKGKFKNISMFFDYSNEFIPLDPMHIKSNVVGILESEERELPSVLFKYLDGEIPVNSGVSNTGYHQNARWVYFISDSNVYLEANKPKNMLHMDIKVVDDAVLEDIVLETIDLKGGQSARVYPFKIIELKKGNISIKMLNGRIRIFYKNIEITNDMGVASEFMCDGKVYKYKDAVWWGYNEISPYKIEMVSEWPVYGIKQVTAVSLEAEKENTINLKVRIESDQDAILDMWYVNNLISINYEKWIRPFSKGMFKKITRDSDPYKFELLDADYAGPAIVGILENSKKRLPALLFISKERDVHMNAGVSNTNYFHNSRCIYVTAGSQIMLEAEAPKEILDLEILISNDFELKKVILDYER